MNAPWVSAFTVIDLDDWSLLFIGERLAHQGHYTTLHDIAGLSGNTPFTLSVVAGDGSKLEDKLNKEGCWDPDKPLARALALVAKEKL